MTTRKEFNENVESGTHEGPIAIYFSDGVVIIDQGDEVQIAVEQIDDVIEALKRAKEATP